MRHAGTGGADPLDRLVVQMYRVGEPHVAAQPAEFLDVLQRRAPEMFAAEGVLVMRLGQVGVQPDAAAAGEFCSVAHQVAGDRER